MLSRRSFIVFAGVSGIAAMAAPLMLRSEKDLIIGMLRDKLPELRMDTANLNNFVEGFLEDYKSTLRRKTTLTSARMLDVLPAVLSNNIVQGPVESAIDYLQSALFNAFFLGTDYFEVYDNSERTVTFFFIPDPYKVGCSNRLANYDPQE